MLGLLVACSSEEAARPDAGTVAADARGAQAATSLPEAFDKELAPTLLTDLDPAPDVVEVELEARVADVELTPGQRVSAWTYNGVLPGPLLRAREGDLVRVHFTNRLPEATTIHWHGLEVPADQDGAGHHGTVIEPGASFSYAFRVPHAGTYWYHPHVNSASQVWHGLYGPLVVEARSEPDLGDEVTLVLSDLNSANGQVSPSAEQGDLGRFFGHEGSRLLVNGRELPTLRAHPGSTLRLRVINAAISRFFRFAIDGHTLERVAGDSGFSERPQRVNDWVLAPGERSEFVVTLAGAAGETLHVRTLTYNRFMCGGDCGEAHDLMQIALEAGTGRTAQVPAELASIVPIDIRGAATRTLELGEQTRDGKTYLSLNGRVHGQDTLEFDAAVGATEVWELKNTTEYDHPFHLHGFRFQVLEQGGRAPAIREWTDTLDMVAKTTARIAVRYDDRPGAWMFHCHILDHADLGMMGVLHVAKP